eukprot:3998226-Pyramimonas_sp.AAC.1
MPRRKESAHPRMSRTGRQHAIDAVSPISMQAAEYASWFIPPRTMTPQGCWQGIRHDSQNWHDSHHAEAVRNARARAFRRAVAVSRTSR